MPSVAVITDNDFNKVSGVTTTLKAVLRHAPPDLTVKVYTAADVEVDAPDYLALASWGVGLPWYPEMRIYWPHLQRLRRRLAADGVDLVHLTTPGPVGLAARWLYRHHPRPLIGSYHTHLGDYVTTYSGSAAFGRGLERYMRWFYGPCATVLVPSAATRALLIAHGYDAAQVQVWSRGVDTDRFRPEARSPQLRAHWGVSDDTLAILYTGRLSSEKGLDLFEPLQRALHLRGVRYRLIFLGDGPLRPALERWCPGAVFEGTVPPAVVAAAMATADAFVFPSATDALGNVVVEAQASGCPVLVTDRGGPREQLVPGVTGWICPAGDADAFAERIADWWRRPAHRREMGDAGVRYARGRSWPHALAPLYDCWREALTRTPRGHRRGA